MIKIAAEGIFIDKRGPAGLPTGRELAVILPYILAEQTVPQMGGIPGQVIPLWKGLLT